MNFIKRNKAFTVVELLVVITVIAILAVIGFVGYTWVIDDARDAQIKDYVAETGKALKTAYYRSDKIPGGQGHFNNSKGVDKTLEGVMDTVSKREGIVSKNAPGPVTTFRYYRCRKTGDEDKFAIFAALNEPSEQDKTNLEKIRVRCGMTTGERGEVPKTGNIVMSYAELFEY